MNNASMHRLASHELELRRSAVETLFASLATAQEEEEEADAEDLPQGELDADVGA